MAINSKNKGNTFERKISKTLSERFESITGNKTGFIRNISSGSYFGGKNQVRMETHDLSKAEFGDIVAPSNFLYSIECKHYATAPSFSCIMKQDIKIFDEWIKKATQDATNARKKMAIIMKFNNVSEAVMISELFGSLKSSINYKEYFIVTLEDFLAQDDSYFFN